MDTTGVVNACTWAAARRSVVVPAVTPSSEAELARTLVLHAAVLAPHCAGRGALASLPCFSCLGTFSRAAASWAGSAG